MKTGSAGACLELHFTSHFANLSPHLLSLHALWRSRPGAFPGQRIPSPARSHHCGQRTSSDPALDVETWVGAELCVCSMCSLGGWQGGCGPRSGCLGLMAFRWICWEQHFEVSAVEQSVKGGPLARSFVRLLFFQCQRNEILPLQFI